MEIDSPNPQHTSLVDKIVVPGDVVLDLSKMSNQTIKLGSGLRRECDTLAAMEAGKFRFLKPNNYWIEGSHKRYIPCVEDTILGIVVDSKPDNFLVDIKGPSLAFLPVLAFEGGTRRNIPKFEVGTLLYVRVVKANSGMNPELACTDGAMMPRKQKKMQLSGNKRSADPSLGGTTSGQASISKRPAQMTRSSQPATSSNFVVCNYCHKSGHIRKECRKRQGKCLRCGLKDHMLSTCPSNRGRPAGSSEGQRQAISMTTDEAEASRHIISGTILVASISKHPTQTTRSSRLATSSNSVVCNYCRKSGHIRKECRKRQGLCLRCGLKDHMLSTCPSNRGRLARSSEGRRQAVSKTTDEAEASGHVISGC